ncbi:MAG: glucuronate isomerase [Acidimicrobiales bacterium]
MPRVPLAHPDRLLPTEPSARAVARELYEQTRLLPIVSMHGHIPAELFAKNEHFSDPTSLLVTPDHYVTRLLHSQGVSLEELGLQPLKPKPGPSGRTEPRSIWRVFCRYWPALQGTASSIWLSHELGELFGIDEVPSEDNADRLYDLIADHLRSPEFLPRSLYARFRLEIIASTDASLDDLASHASLRSDPTFDGSVIPTFRPDDIVDPSRPDWLGNVEKLEHTTQMPTASFEGYLQAIIERRRVFIAAGALATDHGHPSASTLDLGRSRASEVYERLRSGVSEPLDAENFRAHMVSEMAGMSCSDGLVLQLHPGVVRDHDSDAAARFGRDIGGDFPAQVQFTEALGPLLGRFGSNGSLKLVVYTVDEAAYGRELAPMASYYSALKLGAPWWFLDSPDAMRRCWRSAVESAGFWNFAGFVDDSRSLCSIPARHDMARRIVSGELARLVCEHRLSIDSASEVARAYAYDMPKQVFGMPQENAKT